MKEVICVDENVYCAFGLGIANTIGYKGKNGIQFLFHNITLMNEQLRIKNY